MTNEGYKDWVSGQRKLKGAVKLPKGNNWPFLLEQWTKEVYGNLWYVARNTIATSGYFNYYYLHQLELGNINPLENLVYNRTTETGINIDRIIRNYTNDDEYDSEQFQEYWDGKLMTTIEELTDGNTLSKIRESNQSFSQAVDLKSLKNG